MGSPKPLLSGGSPARIVQANFTNAFLAEMVTTQHLQIQKLEARVLNLEKYIMRSDMCDYWEDLQVKEPVLSHSSPVKSSIVDVTRPPRPASMGDCPLGGITFLHQP